MDIKYLIENEETIDWKKLSLDKDTSFSALEARLFKDRICWSEYIVIHKDKVTMEILEICKDKIFPTTLTVFLLLYFDEFAEDFIMKYPENVDFEFILKYKTEMLSEDALLATKNYWEKIPDIKEILANFLDTIPERPDYSRLRLIYETL